MPCTMVSPVTTRIAPLIVILCAACLLVGASITRADQLIAVGDGTHLWVLQPDPQGEGFTALYRKYPDQPATELFPVGTGTIRGQLKSSGVAAGGGRLWLIYDTGQVQSILAFDDERGQRGYTDTTHASIPTGITLRSLAANWTGPWALVRVENAQTLDHLDNTSAAKQPSQPVKVDTDEDRPSTKNSKQHSSSAKDTKNFPTPTKGDSTPKAKERPLTTDLKTANNTGKETGKPAPVQVDRLLILKKNVWTSVPQIGRAHV